MALRQLVTIARCAVMSQLAAEAVIITRSFPADDDIFA